MMSVRSYTSSVLALYFLASLARGYGAVTDGMDCHTTAGFTYCEGKGTNYLQGEKTVSPQASDDGLMTRFMPPSSGGGGGGGSGGGGYGGYPNYGTSLFGYTPRSRCDQNRGSGCKQVNVRARPTLLMNSRGEPRYILQVPWLPQQLDLAICTDTTCSYGRGRCDQRFINLQLLSWDPDGSHYRLGLDTFRIPSCCRCQGGGYGGGYNNGYGGGQIYFPRS